MAGIGTDYRLLRQAKANQATGRLPAFGFSRRPVATQAAISYNPPVAQAVLVNGSESDGSSTGR
jgi:hypothetical protein